MKKYLITIYGHSRLTESLDEVRALTKIYPSAKITVVKSITLSAANTKHHAR